eukprot:4815439-Amphidinium_carterae.1
MSCLVVNRVLCSDSDTSPVASQLILAPSWDCYSCELNSVMGLSFQGYLPNISVAGACVRRCHVILYVTSRRQSVSLFIDAPGPDAHSRQSQPWIRGYISPYTTKRRDPKPPLPAATSIAMKLKCVYNCCACAKLVRPSVVASSLCAVFQHHTPKWHDGSGEVKLYSDETFQKTIPKGNMQFVRSGIGTMFIANGRSPDHL